MCGSVCDSHEMTKSYMEVGVCIDQGQDGERKYFCAFFLNNGEDWKRVELVLGN